MKPLKPKKSVEGISRAKMYIKRDLEFLIGFPDQEGMWVSFPECRECESVSLTREHIHKATFTINKLVREFPRAMPKIVGDVDKWSERHKSLLEKLKQFVHQEKALNTLNPDFGEVDKQLYKKLISDNQDMKNVVYCFSWITWLQPETFKSALIWMDEFSENIGEIYRNLGSSEGLKAIVRLWRISNRIGIKRVRPIVLWTSDTRIFEVPIDEGYQYAYQLNASLGRKKRETVPDIPKAKFGNGIVEFIEWLSMQDEQTVKRSVELFDMICDKNYIDQWQEWWKLLNDKAKVAQNIQRPASRSNPINKKLESLREEIKEIAENAPPPIKSKVLFNLFKELSGKDNLNKFKLIHKVIGVIPCEYERVPLRIAFLIYWNSLIEDNNCSKNRVFEIINEFAKFIESKSDFSKAINPWIEVLNNWKRGDGYSGYIFTIDDEILDETTDKKDIWTVFDLLNELYRDNEFEGLQRNEKSNLVKLVDIVKKEQVLNLFYDLRKNEISNEYISKNILELTSEITGHNFERFVSVFKRFLAIEDRYFDISKILKPILIKCDTNEYRDLFVDAVVGGQQKVLCEISLKIGIMNNYGEKAIELPLPLQNNRDWILSYPKELHNELNRLAFADDNAIATAERILSKVFPSKDCLEKELSQLLLKIEAGEDKNGFLGIRVENLKKRIEGKQNDETNRLKIPVLSEQKLKNISSKIKHSAMIKVLDKWNKELDCQFRSILCDKLKIEEFPKWLERKNILEIILSTGDLTPTFQSIVLKILERRASNKPWDFRDEASNSLFIKRLEEKNINMEPWVDGTDNIIETLSNGDEIKTSIERDPIEIFSMGLYFQTCLSPGSSNFFSVFSNIIDINKQVVYAKNSKGVVKARALIVLTDNGGILTYNPYCNDPNFDFKSILKEFVHILAKKMNAVVLPTGNVSNLIAPNWYNDGPCNLAEKFLFKLDKEELSEISQKDLLLKMEKAVEPLGLSELTIPLFIQLPEFKKCEKLIDILFPYVLRQENLQSDALFKYAQALLYNEKSEMLKRLTPKIVEHVLKLNISNDYWAVKHWIDILIHVSPNKALEVLKKTRRKGIRIWEEDYDGDRLTDVGRVYLKLNRRVQASKLFSIAIEKYISVEAREYCIEQLNEK